MSDHIISDSALYFCCCSDIRSESYSGCCSLSCFCCYSENYSCLYYSENPCSFRCYNLPLVIPPVNYITFRVPQASVRKCLWYDVGLQEYYGLTSSQLCTKEHFNFYAIASQNLSAGTKTLQESISFYSIIYLFTNCSIDHAESLHGYHAPLFVIIAEIL